MTAYVVDSSVGLKWFLAEVYQADAQRLQNPAHQLHVPTLFDVELGNILWKKARVLRVREITVTEGRDILRLLLTVPLMVHPMAPLLETAYDLAVGPERPTVYDSCYLALARALGCRLVTADRSFYDAMGKGPAGPFLLWVADPI